MESNNKRKSVSRQAHPLLIPVLLLVIGSIVVGCAMRKRPDTNLQNAEESVLDAMVNITDTTTAFTETTLFQTSTLSSLTETTLISERTTLPITTTASTSKTTVTTTTTTTTTASATTTTTQAAPAGTTLATSTVPPWSVGSREIYLTFDDGPCQNTPQVLDILDAHGAKATFFTVGFFVDRYPEYAAAIVQHGNLLACHSYTHEFSQCYASADAFMDEVARWRTSALNACGTLPDRMCIRFPGGSTTKYAASCRDDIVQRIANAGYRYFDWNCGDNDKWPAGNTKGLPQEEYFMQSYTECINWYKEKPNEPVIFLMHDTEIGTVHILSAMLTDLENRGYTFKTLDQHPAWN